MVWIPPGTFLMGSPWREAERKSDETLHQVTLTQGFWMGQFEVTQGEYLDVIGNNPSYFQDGWHNPDTGDSVTNGLAHPVDSVTWLEATDYCARLTERERLAGRLPEGYLYRLPTEEEWEYACRAGTTNAFHYGAALRAGMANFYELEEYDSALGTISNPSGTYLGRTTEVGSYLPNGFGLYDMHGNVVEWCQDWLGGLYVVRGGGFARNGSDCRSARRVYYYDTSRYSMIGFRVVVAPDQL